MKGEPMKLNQLLTAILLSLLAVGAAHAQGQKFDSPRKSTEMTLNGKKISVDYGSPAMHERKIVGGLVPYGKVWRTGANKATHFMTEADLTIGGVAVPKGTYTLYTLPSESGWKLIINKQTEQWGTVYDQAQDFARIDLKVGKTSAPVDSFTISLVPAGSGGMLKLEWESTSASVMLAEKK